MGCFYGSMQIRGEDREAVRVVLERMARADKNRFWLGPHLGGWIGVYSNLLGQDPSIAEDLARRLPGELFHVMVHDDDVFAYDYYRDGHRVDQYCSRPDYFGSLPERERKSPVGQPESFAHLAIDAGRFSALRSGIAEQETRPAMFASELLMLLASALGISNVQTCYEYLNNGESDVDGWADFHHIPDLRVEKTRQRKADAALHDETRRLLREGLLLAEHGGHRGRKVPSPHWCPSADGAGFLAVWAPPEFTSREPVPVKQIGPPWSGGPIPIGLTTDPTVVQLVLSPSGRFLATACSAGDATAAAWHLGDGRYLAQLARGHAAYRVEFVPDESAMVCLGTSVDSPSGEIVILPLGPSEPHFIEFPKPKSVAFHPEGRKLAVLDWRNRLSVLDFPSCRLDRVLFIGGIRPPMNAAFVLGPDYPRDWLTMSPGALEDLLRRKQDELLGLHESQIEHQPIHRVESLRKDSRARIEAFGRHARAAPSETRSPAWLEDKAMAGEFVNQLMFDSSGERLFAATLSGVRVYAWRDVLEASGEMPTPSLAVNLDPWMKGTEQRNSFVGCLAYDPERDWLLFAGQEGRVRYLDLADGRDGVLLEPYDRPAIGHMALSRDRSALGLTGDPHFNEEGPRRTRRRDPVLGLPGPLPQALRECLSRTPSEAVFRTRKPADVLPGRFIGFARWFDRRSSRIRLSGGFLGQRVADLPVMAEGIDHASQSPSVRFLHRGHLLGTGRECRGEDGIGIRHGQDHPDGPAAQRLRTEIAILGRFVAQPELRARNGQPRHNRTGRILHPVDLDRPEGRLVELDRTRTAANRQQRRDRAYDGHFDFGMEIHTTFLPKIRLSIPEVRVWRRITAYRR